MDGNFIGRRPTTLIGFSLGARVIFYCLKVNLFLCALLSHLIIMYIVVAAYCKLLPQHSSAQHKYNNRVYH